jgi:hypothetical protein
VDRLTSDAEGVANLLPRPARAPGFGNVSRFNAFGKTMQSADGAQAGRRISGAQLFAKVPWFHGVSLI